MVHVYMYMLLHVYFINEYDEHINPKHCYGTAFVVLELGLINEQALLLNVLIIIFLKRTCTHSHVHFPCDNECMEQSLTDLYWCRLKSHIII